MSVNRYLRRLQESYRETRAIAPGFKSAKAYANWARANYEMWRQVGRVRARPLKLTVDVTNICQLRCPLCPTGAGAVDREQGQTGVPAFEQLLEELGEYVFFIDFYNWGEPLLNPQLAELVECAERRGIVTGISSNLSLSLSDERIRSLVRSGLSQLVCSIDGASQETYATYRRGGRFELAFRNMRRFLEIRRELGRTRPWVTWQFLVFRFNEHEREEVRRMAERIGVDRVRFVAPYLDSGRFPLPVEDAAAIRSWAPEDPAFDRSDPSHPDHADPRAPVRRRCDWHYVSSAVNWDGSVAPCCTVHETRDDFGVLDYNGGRGYMDVVNNDSFQHVRNLFAGRSSESRGLICERCPTPSIMDYGTHLNRRIAMLLVSQAVRIFRSPLERWRRPSERGSAAASPLR